MAGPVIRLVHVVHSLSVGGTETGVVNLVNSLPEFDHTVAAMTVSGPLAHRLPPGVPNVTLNKRTGLDGRTFVRLIALFRRLRPDIVHSRGWSSIDAVVAARIARVPAIVHGEHGREAFDPHGRNRRRRRLRSWLAPLVDRFVTVSFDLRRWLIDDVGVPVGKVMTIHNGVDTGRFSDEDRLDGRAALGIGDERVVIGTVGRLEPVKDHMTLVEAFAQIRKAHPAVRLVLVGDGPSRPALEGRLTGADIAGHVDLLGERTDIARLMKGFDVFVLPSLAEGISNTVLEAMASGLPVVATRTGGNPELVEDGVTGRLIPVGVPDVLADVLVGYLSDPHLRAVHGKAGRQRALAEFSLERMTGRYADLYRLLAGRGRA